MLRSDVWISELVIDKEMRLHSDQPSPPLEQFLRSFLLKLIDYVEKMEIKVVTRGKWKLGKHQQCCVQSCVRILTFLNV